jgi:hypothetical protein
MFKPVSSTELMGGGENVLELPDGRMRLLAITPPRMG